MSKKNNQEIGKRKCPYIVGSNGCIKSVEKGKCPSGITTINEIGKIESGRRYCAGRQ